MFIRVKPKVLIFISGILWSFVGILLNHFAAKWFVNLPKAEKITSIVFGGIMGIIIAYFGFNKIAKNNIKRILEYKDKACFFAFQSWKSYIIIVIMISMGIFMRTSGLIPKYILTPIYIGIGLALFIAGIQYYIVLLRK
ncbi:MAG: hypothetical protein K9J13_01635 [Saprospiraceae bacterium]|nr:hypothetical protein [Saprospiraceae bacterium]